MLLEIDNLSVAYLGDDGSAADAVRGVSLSLDRGETLGLVGESGSGKSTVAMAVPRLIPSPPALVRSGRVLLDGEDVLAMDVKRLREIRGRRIGVIFQEPMTALSPLWRVGEQLVEAIRLKRDISAAAARELALDWFGRVGIAEPAAKFRALAHELSGGMQQRVMIAMALVNEPDLLIADEPTTALDVTVQAQILSLIRKLRRASSAVLFITHDLGVVSENATKIAVMKNGEIVERSNDPAEFFAAPRHPYSRSLVAAARAYSLPPPT